MFKKFIPILPHIIATLFLAGFAVYAWTEPGSTPPGGNVASPLNVGPTEQTKEGGLILKNPLKLVTGSSWPLTFQQDVFSFFSIINGGQKRFTISPEGKVGIGVDNPSEKLDVQGGNMKVGTATIKGDGSVSTNLNAPGVKALVMKSQSSATSSSYYYCYSNAETQTFTDGKTTWTELVCTTPLQTFDGKNYHQVIENQSPYFELYNFNGNSFVPWSACAYVKPYNSFYNSFGACQTNTGQIKACASGLNSSGYSIATYIYPSSYLHTLITCSN